MERILPLVDAGVDYLTCTYTPEAVSINLQFLLAQLTTLERKNGALEHEWSMSGYAGKRVGGLQWGKRDDGLLVRLSGEVARDWWSKFGRVASNCSRIDLQQTVMAGDSWPAVIRTHWSEMVSWWRENTRRPEPKVIAGPTGPQSIYSGQRVSDVFLRLYHRGSKRGNEQSVGHVRYEGELKGDKARAVLGQLCSASDPEHYLRGQCLTMFEKRGCRPLLNYDAQSCSHVAASIYDVGNCLRWFRKAVRPSIERLIAEGYRDEVLEALGLDQLVQPNLRERK